jgi:hypothetical protein
MESLVCADDYMVGRNARLGWKHALSRLPLGPPIPHFSSSVLAAYRDNRQLTSPVDRNTQFGNTSDDI